MTKSLRRAFPVIGALLIVAACAARAAALEVVRIAPARWDGDGGLAPRSQSGGYGNVPGIGKVPRSSGGEAPSHQRQEVEKPYDICRGQGEKPGAHADPKCDQSKDPYKAASRDPQIIRMQLRRGIEYAELAIRQLDASGASSAVQAKETANECYKVIRFAQHGIERRIEREPNPPPVLKQLVAQMNLARKHNRIAMTALHGAAQAAGISDAQQTRQQAYGGTGQRQERRGTESRGRDVAGAGHQKASASITRSVDSLRQVITLVHDVMTRMP